MSKSQTPAERIAERIEGQIAGDTALEYGPHEECFEFNKDAIVAIINEEMAEDRAGYILVANKKLLLMDMGLEGAESTINGLRALNDELDAVARQALNLPPAKPEVEE